MTTDQIPAISQWAFALILCGCVLLAGAELRWPARHDNEGGNRILANFGLGIITLAMPMLIPLSSIAGATYADVHGFGLLRAAGIEHFLAAALLLFLVRSLTDYWVHRLYHRWAFLWPLHRLHHSDQVIDLSTTLRAHPITSLLNMAINMALVVAVGPPLLAVILVDAIIFFAAFIQHANVRIPSRTAQIVEKIWVTPSMHLVHHARHRELHDSNYGEILSVWDHIFGTYRAQPADDFAIGVEKATQSSSV